MLREGGPCTEVGWVIRAGCGAGAGTRSSEKSLGERECCASCGGLTQVV